MITVESRPDGTFARQGLSRPVVYLDHWAVRGISSSPEMSRRFVAGLHASGGTLALSVMNLAEFAAMTCTAAAQQADAFLDLVGRSIYFIDTEPAAVAAREDAVSAGHSDHCPAADDELLRYFVEQPSDRAEPVVGKRTFQRFVEMRAQLQDAMSELKVNVPNAVQKLRDRCDGDPIALRRAQNAPATTGRRWSTWPLLECLFRRYVFDRSARLEANDVLDILHAVVPCSYCDIVLLDSRWAAAVEEARKRFSDNKIQSHLARVYSPRNGGIEAMVSKLEHWRSEPQ